MTWTWLGIAAVLFILFLSVLGFRRGFIREVVSAAFVILSLLLVSLIDPYVNSFLRENTSLESFIEEKCDTLVRDKSENIQNMGQEGQNLLLNNLGLPRSVTRELIQENTADTYRQLAVNSFSDYVSKYLTNLLINGISFLLSYLLITAAVRILLSLLDLIAKLPVINGVNRIAGAVIGAGKAVIFLWIVLLVLTVLCGTAPGKAGMELVEQDTVLTFLYDQDILIKWFLNIF